MYRVTLETLHTVTFSSFIEFQLTGETASEINDKRKMKQRNK